MSVQLEKTEPDINHTCCFTGLRPQKMPFGFDESNELCKRIKNQLEQKIIHMITEQQVTHFICGMALGVDQWAAEAVLSLHERFPQITLECALPCETQAEAWTVEQRERYFSILERCSKETLLQKHYTSDCMQKRNGYVVNKSRYVIAVWDGSRGGTSNTVRFARRRGKEVQMIDPMKL